MTLNSFIDTLSKIDKNLLIGVKHGRKTKWVKEAFSHSDRSNYADLSITLCLAENGFDITKCCTVKDLLQNLLLIKDTMVQGYKGGNFVMHGEVNVSITTDDSICGIPFYVKKTKQALLFIDDPFSPIKEMFFRK